MKTAVIFCDHISERKLSKCIQKFYDFKTKFTLLNYPTGFYKDTMHIEILENFGEIDDQPYQWCIDITSHDESVDKFKNEVSKLSQYLKSQCTTLADLEQNINFD
jgi:hypothetical protein